MRRSVRVAALAAVATLSLVASACSSGGQGSSGANAAGGSGGEITVRGCTPQEALIGSNTTESCGHMVLSTISSQLIRYNPDTAAPENDIAESIETSDNQNFTIKLKQDRTFHDGTPVLAKNFVDAWNYAAYGPNGMQGSYFFEPIEGFQDLQCGTSADCAKEPAKTDKMSGLKVVDDHTFTVRTSSPVSNLPLRLGYTVFAPMPDSFFADRKAYEAKPVSAGPYKFVSQDASNIVVEKDPGYKGPWPGQTDKITFRIYQSTDAAYADVVANNLDVTDEVPPGMLVNDQWKSDAADRNTTAKEGVIQLLAFSPVDEKLKNPDLRKAISMAINREEITKQVFMGTRAPSDSWVAPSVDGYKAGACGDTCTYNPEEAKKLYQKSGGYPGTLTIAVNGDGSHKAWADATCNSIKNTLGNDCQVIVTPDFKTLLDQMKNREIKGMFRYGWQMDYPSIENFLTPVYATNASSNYFNYSSPDFDRLLKEGNEAKSADAANAKWQEAEQVLGKDLPTLPLWSTTRPVMWSTHVDNVKVTPFGEIDYTAVKVKG